MALTLKQFLEHPAIQLPIKRDKDDFQGFVAERLDTYLALFDQLEDGDLAKVIRQSRSAVAGFCEAAKWTIASVFTGHTAGAYGCFLKAIEFLKDNLEEQRIPDEQWKRVIPFFRVRRSTDSSLGREDLFHIPFEDRHKVATQRYSIPGLPCLYLSGSVYTCWAEMGRPPFHELQASAFWLAEKTSVSILDFSTRPIRLQKYFGKDPTLCKPHLQKLIANHVILWPLMALCSIVVKHREGSFKPEYIVPQILLQWISKERFFDAICYFSMHVPAVTPDRPLATCNLVFPTRIIKPTGRCGFLRHIFRMTEPYGWELLRAVHAGEGTPGGIHPIYDFEFIDGRPERYHTTEFGKVEATLVKIAVDQIWDYSQVIDDRAARRDAGQVKE